MAYAPRCYRTDGGNRWVVESGGTLDLKTGSILKVGGVLVSSVTGDLVKTGTYASASPLAIGTVVTGKYVKRVIVKIGTPFNGTAPTITIGDSGDNARLVPAVNVDCLTAGTYIITPVVLYGSDTAVNVYITPDGSSAGTFTIIMELA